MERLIRAAAVRRLAQAHGQRVGADFLEAVNEAVHEALEGVCRRARGEGDDPRSTILTRAHAWDEGLLGTSRTTDDPFAELVYVAGAASGLGCDCVDETDVCIACRAKAVVDRLSPDSNGKTTKTDAAILDHRRQTERRQR